MAATDKWISLRTACDYLGVSIVTARKWIKAKALRTKKTPVGRGRHMVLRSDVERLYR